jgi:hypothetical protein
LLKKENAKIIKLTNNAIIPKINPVIAIDLFFAGDSPLLILFNSIIPVIMATIAGT